MRKRIPFFYREFYDVPRYILAEYAGTVFLLDSPFDEALDDYSPTYTVSRVPGVHLPESKDAIDSVWDHLLSLPHRRIGTVPVNQVRFDRTLRRLLDATILDGVLFYASCNLDPSYKIGLLS